MLSSVSCQYLVLKYVIDLFSNLSQETWIFIFETYVNVLYSYQLASLYIKSKYILRQLMQTFM